MSKNNHRAYFEKVFKKYLIYREKAKKHQLACDLAFNKLDQFYLSKRKPAESDKVGHTFNWADHTKEDLELLNDYHRKADKADQENKLMGLFEYILAEYRPFMDLMDKESLERRAKLLDKIENESMMNLPTKEGNYEPQESCQ